MLLPADGVTGLRLDGSIRLMPRAAFGVAVTFSPGVKVPKDPRADLKGRDGFPPYAATFALFRA